LLRRLHEAGIGRIFGVPGDYKLELMQQLKDRDTPPGLALATNSTDPMPPMVTLEFTAWPRSRSPAAWDL